MRNFILIFFLFSSFLLSAQCPNANFEQGNFSNWTGSTGDCCPIDLFNNGIVNGRHTIMTGNGTDPNTCNTVPVVAPGGLFSAQLGNDDIGAEAEGLSYTFFVTPQTTLITYQYAVVFEDPGHIIEEQPRFQSRILLQNGDTIPCTEYSVTAASNLPGFQTCPGLDSQGDPIQISYRNWTSVGVDVSAYIGQTVTLQFETGDCSLGGHYGYAYVDATCGPLENSVQYCAGSDSAIVTAPAGFSSYLWSTGETTQQIVVNPNDIQNLTCTVTSFSGCQAILTTDLTPTIVNPSFTYSGQCVGNINFINTSVTQNGFISSYIWSFGDGSPASNLENPSHLYLSPGTYLATLTTITDQGCASSYAAPVTILPYVNVNFGHTYACLGQNVNFTDLSQSLSLGYDPLYWNWSFGDGSSTNVQNPSHLYSSVGTYNVTLRAGNDSICIDSLSRQITIVNLPIANFLTNDVCQGAEVIMINSSTNTAWNTNSSFFWDFGYGGATSFAASPTITYPFPGTYNISLILTNSNNLYTCRDTIQNTVEIYSNPNVNFLTSGVTCINDSVFFINSSSIQSGTIINYVWNFGDGTLSNLVNPTHVYNVNGTYNISLIATSDMLCRDTVIKQISIADLPLVSFTPDISAGCVPLTVNFSDLTFGNNVSWYWDFGDGSFSTSQNVSHSYQSAGTYDVSLLVTSSQGCSSSFILENLINVYPNPIALFGYSPEVITDTSSLVNFSNLSLGGSFYQWYFGDGSNSNEFEPSHEYVDPGLFTVKLFVENQYECVDTFMANLLVRATFGFFIPSAFTPNGNNKNDSWYPVFRNIKEFTCYVFDRWGEIIFVGTKDNPAWDGTYKGTIVQNDVYVYMFTVKDIYDEVYVYRGRITVIR
jgi:gliding motility-associated-like protein